MKGLVNNMKKIISMEEHKMNEIISEKIKTTDEIVNEMETEIEELKREIRQLWKTCGIANLVTLLVAITLFYHSYTTTKQEQTQTNAANYCVSESKDNGIFFDSNETADENSTYTTEERDGYTIVKITHNNKKSTSETGVSGSYSIVKEDLPEIQQ